MTQQAAKQDPPLPPATYLVQRHNGVANFAPSNAPLLAAPDKRGGDESYGRHVYDVLLDRKYRVGLNSFY